MKEVAIANTANRFPKSTIMGPISLPKAMVAIRSSSPNELKPSNPTTPTVMIANNM